MEPRSHDGGVLDTLGLRSDPLIARILIIGYGNPLRGDDGFGPAAAGRLRQTIRDPEVEILAVHQLTPELMEPLGRAERVLFIDASLEGNPGELRFERVRLRPEAGAAFTHFSTPSGLLAGALALYGTSPEAALATTAGADFGLGERLSAPVQEALDALLAHRIGQWIAGWNPA